MIAIDRANLVALLNALDASHRSLGRDQCGDWAIVGKAGHIYVDGLGFLLYVTTGESPRRWNNIKRRLAFCQLNQDGDDEGCLHLDRLPTPTEAALIREALGIRRKRNVTAEARDQLARARSLLNRPETGPPFVQTSGPLPSQAWPHEHLQAGMDGGRQPQPPAPMVLASPAIPRCYATHARAPARARDRPTNVPKVSRKCPANVPLASHKRPEGPTIAPARISAARPSSGGDFRPVSGMFSPT